MKLLLTATVWLVAACSMVQAQISIGIDTSVHYQTITGWEATAFIGGANSMALPRYRDELLRMAVEELGITRLRLEVRSGCENSRDYYAEWAAQGYPSSPDSLYTVWRQSRYATVNDNADSSINWNGFHFTDLDWRVENVVLPMRQLLAARGEKLHVNVCYVAFTGQIQGGAYIHDDADEYAEFVLATYLHLQQRHGIVPDSWEILLEPDNVSQWNGTTIGNAMVAAAKRLEDWGFTPHFVAPSTTNMGNALTYFDRMAAVPGALDHLAELSYHRYGGVSLQNLQSIASRAAQHGLQTSMLEWWFGRASHDILHEDLKVGNNSAWQDRTLLGMVTVDTSNAASPRLGIDKVSEYNRLYFLAARPGAERLEATSSAADHDALAFINADGRMSLVVNAASAASYSVSGLAPGRYRLRYTTAQVNDARHTDAAVGVDGTMQTSIPSAGVLILQQIDHTSGLAQLHSPVPKLSVYPQPLSESAVLSLDAASNPGPCRLRMYDLLGRLVLDLREISLPFTLSRTMLIPGLLLYRLTARSGEVAAGLLLVK